MDLELAHDGGMLVTKFGVKSVSDEWEKMENCIFSVEPFLGQSAHVLDSSAQKNLDKPRTLMNKVSCPLIRWSRPEDLSR